MGKLKKGWQKALAVIGIILACIVLLFGALLLVMTRDYSGKDPIAGDPSVNSHIVELGSTQVSAHRSGGGIAPENTMMAFKNCIESADFTIDIFEYDLHLTKDKELVLLHDETLSRTSDSTELFGNEDAKPSDYTYEELRQLNMGESFTADNGKTPYKGLRGDDIPEDLRILKLTDLLDYLTANGDFDYIIEIKDGGDRGKEACDKLHSILVEYGLLDNAIIGTFHGEISNYMTENYPDMARSAGIKEVFGFYFNSLLNIKRADDYYSYCALQIPDDDYVVKLGTTRLINYAHKHNIAVQFWTINDKDKVEELINKGADAIMSDLPDMVYEVKNK